MLEAGITILSVLPVRTEPSHRSELVTQLLFGEIYTVLEKQADWLKIEGRHDGYSGYISLQQHYAISEKTEKELELSDKSIVVDLVHSITGNEVKFPVSIGSILYHFDGLNCRIGKEKYHFSGKTYPYPDLQAGTEKMIKVAQKWLEAPYLWGGRSPFGVDCSGFTQVVYKVAGVTLPRDAWQQADCGKTVHFIHEAKAGDLAFFSNEEGRIVHVGILINQREIIHASGKVRKDPIDHYGIYHSGLKKYSHQLRIIKRIL